MKILVLSLAMLLSAPTWADEGSGGEQGSRHDTGTATQTETSTGKGGGGDHGGSGSSPGGGTSAPVDTAAEAAQKAAAAKALAETNPDKKYYNDNIAGTPEQLSSTGQAGAFTSASNAFFRCASAAIEGRTDGVCEKSPDDPACVGSNRAATNATSCKKYFTPATLGCAEYGAGGNSMEEWLAFGDVYMKTATECFGFYDTTQTASTNMINLVEVLSPTKLSPAGPFLSGSSRASGISGRIKSEKMPSAWDAIQSKFSDNASVFGYQDGDIFKSMAKGETYSQVVLASPFVDNLNAVNRDKAEAGLGDSQMIVAHVKEGLALAKGGTGAEKSDEPLAANDMPLSAEAAPAPETVAAAGAKVIMIAPPAPPTVAVPVVAAAAKPTADDDKPFARRRTEAERIAALESMATEARAKGRSLASIMMSRELQTAIDDAADLTLFQRVHLTYRKRARGIKALEPSATGEAMRHMDKPYFFRNL